MGMRQEWVESADEKELIMSMDEVLATPDAGKVIVQINVDYMADCKVSELPKTIDMIVILHKKGKISDSDIVSAMSGLVEFIDSFACDNPRIYDFVGDMFCHFANINALTVDWLCDSTAKVMDDNCKSKVIEGAMKSLKKAFGERAVQSCFGGQAEKNALEKLLGPAEFQKLAAEYL